MGSNSNNWDLGANAGGATITFNDINGIGAVQMPNGSNGSGPIAGVMSGNYRSYPNTYYGTYGSASGAIGPWKQPTEDPHEEPSKPDLKDYLRRKVLKK